MPIHSFSTFSSVNLDHLVILENLEMTKGMLYYRPYEIVLSNLTSPKL